MSAGTLDDIRTLTIAVRVYDHDELLTCELVESEDDAAEVIERWADLANLIVVADEHHHPTFGGPGAVIPRDEPLDDADDGRPLAMIPLPGYGTE